MTDEVLRHAPLRSALRSNMHDGDEGGELRMSVQRLLDETVEVVREFLLDDEMIAAIHEDPEVAVDELVERLGGLYVVSGSTEPIKPGQSIPVLGRFTSEEEAAAFIGSLPGHLDGHYNLDPPYQA